MQFSVHAFRALYCSKCCWYNRYLFWLQVLLWIWRISSVWYNWVFGLAVTLFRPCSEKRSNFPCWNVCGVRLIELAENSVLSPTVEAYKFSDVVIDFDVLVLESALYYIEAYTLTKEEFVWHGCVWAFTFINAIRLPYHFDELITVLTFVLRLHDWPSRVIVYALPAIYLQRWSYCVMKVAWSK
jgi:hypothetical protein